MSRIRSKNTAVERQVFNFLRKEGINFKKHYKAVPGSPDVAVPSKKRAVFVEGAFWHGWGYKRLRPRLSPFWRRKIENNMRRDRRNMRRLRKLDWKVMRVWDHRLKRKPKYWLSKTALFLMEG